MNKNSIFFSIYGIVPNSSQRFYYHSNKQNSLNLVTYIKDAHSFDDLGNKKLNFFNYHDNEIFDIKQGNIKFDSIRPVHKKSIVFRTLVSLDEELSKKPIFTLYWQDVSSIIFNTLIKYQDWDINDWEMQAAQHLNTNNVHFHMRIYQNDKTKDNNIYRKYALKKETLKAIKRNIFTFIKSKEKDTPLLFPHVLKRAAIYDYNNNIKKHKELILDFVSLINLKKIDKNTQPILNKITTDYYNQHWLSSWSTSIAKKLSLSDPEKQTFESIIKNNICNELHLFIKSNKKLKVFNFIAKADPNEKSYNKQKFKNFDKISKVVDFETLATYQPKTIKRIYKEPFGRFIEYTFNQPQFNLSELETSINNYLSTVRPNLSQKLTIKPLEKHQVKIN